MHLISKFPNHKISKSLNPIRKNILTFLPRNCLKQKIVAMKFLRTSVIASLYLLPALVFAQTENIDQNVMSQIRKEGLQNSKVMDIAFHLTDASGPRVTASPGF